MVLRPRVATVLFVCLLPSALPAQQDRIRDTIDARHSIVIRNSVPRQAARGFDRGAVEPGFRLPNITFLFKPSDAQQAALDELLKQQQDPASPNYHNWLSPEEFANRFSVSTADMEKIDLWLRSHGFEIRYTARGRDFISFSGTASQVEAAFHTEIHRYRIGNEAHFANATDLSLPEAIAPMVTGVMGMHDFHPKAPHKRRAPVFTDSDGSHFLAPDDFATIYNLNPLYNYGFAGAGQSIVIVGQSDINLKNIAAFRDLWSLPPTKIQMVPTGSYPGTSEDDEIEADLDLEWAGAVARYANLIFVYSEDADYSAYYAIDNNIAPVISESFGLCELVVGSYRLGLTGAEPEAKKANALGITWLVSSGDSGAAGCDYQDAMASQGFGVSFPASIPEVTAVGGTEFNEGSLNYWTSGNGINYKSAMSYIPETTWNDTAASGGLAASGGGVSAYYKKPSWQSGPGVPNDGARDVPDLSMAASNAHDPYIIVAQGDLFGVGGTSASAPAFAGVIAVLNQFLVENQVQSKPGVGNINPKLYSMATGTPGVFHDITSGDNIIPCQTGSADCVNGHFGYKAGPGYDLATGLGSVDAYNFVTAWAGIPVSPTTMTLVASPGTITSTGSTVLTASVKAASGTRSPTGSVSFTLNGLLLGSAALSGSGTTASASLTIDGNQLPAAANTIEARYSGSIIFNPSSTSTAVNIGLPTATSAVTVTVNPNPVYQHAPDANGATLSFTIQLQETAGVATTVTGFTFGGVDYTNSLASLFGGTALAANGTLSAPVSGRDIAVPSTQVLVFTGRDASGATWRRQVSVSFLPHP
jgi:subtilase family serine protease